MTVNVDRDAKTRIARGGPVRLFGDWDRRRDMSEDGLAAVFDAAWSQGLEQAVQRGKSAEIDFVRSRLTEKQRPFLHSEAELRVFRFQAIEFVAQIENGDGGQQFLTQLWKIQSGDDHPKTLFVNFDTVQEREQFRELALRHGWNDEELALSLIRDFVDKLSRMKRG